jgi:hypothetical protein
MLKYLELVEKSRMKLFDFSEIFRLKYLRISCFLLVGSTGKILHVLRYLELVEYLA